jgi:predicted membrane channel-forming protein YqfA (hemolysin III family)
MPKLSCWFLKSSLIYFFMGTSIGAFMLIGKGIGYTPFQGMLLQDHIDLLLIGWVFQFVFGISFWIFPRTDKKRKYEPLAWLSFFFFNIGVILSLFSFLSLLGKSFVILGLLFFLLPIWARVKGISQIQENFQK